MHRLTLIPLLLGAALLVNVACRDETDEPTGPIIPAPSVVSRVTIKTANDTLPAYPGDTVSTFITVTVRDQNDSVMAGVPVHFTVSDSAAYLEFSDDTTDALGRASVPFYSTWWRDHTNTVTGSAGGLEAAALIYTCDMTFNSPDIYLTVGDSTLYLGRDSLLIEVRMEDGYGSPAAFLTPSITAASGTLRPWTWTDSTGYTSTYWFPADTGEVWIEASYQWQRICRTFLLADTKWVTVRSEAHAPVAQVQIFAPDTVYVSAHDTATAQVHVLVTSETGVELPGRHVMVSLENPAIGFLEFVNPELQDTTNEFGRVIMTYSTWQTGVQRIFAVCDTIAAEPHVLTTLAP